MAGAVKEEREQLKPGQLILTQQHWDFLKKRRFIADKSYSESVRDALDLLMQKEARKEGFKKGMGDRPSGRPPL